ncbi:MAG: STAS domain-containing protein [Candidatus Aminicenantes bacterium]|nr:STAS domain-containing protein [Candidatus Aminicenantes bacterium]
MNIKETKEGSKIIMFLSGSIDIPGAESLKKALNVVVDGGAKEVVFDFKEVNFIGSSGIGKLLIFYKNFTAKGGQIYIENLNKEIKALFRAIKLDKLFNI